ncbi:MAG: hypothetical protein ABL966_02815 [Acidimicrobiales bacterium]
MRRTIALLALVAGGLLGPTACSDDGGSAESLCRAVAEGDGLTNTFQDFDPSDPETALDQLRTARVALGDLLDDAPDEVRDDLQVEIDYVQALIDALEPVDPGDATEAALQVQSVTDAHPDVDDAATNLAAFAARECSPPTSETPT